MLTLIFGIWMNMSQVTWLVQEDKGCNVNFVGTGYGSYGHAGPLYIDHTCDEVAAEINKVKK